MRENKTQVYKIDKPSCYHSFDRKFSIVQLYVCHQTYFSSSSNLPYSPTNKCQILKFLMVLGCWRSSNFMAKLVYNSRSMSPNLLLFRLGNWLLALVMDCSRNLICTMPGNRKGQVAPRDYEQVSSSKEHSPQCVTGPPASTQAPDPQLQSSVSQRTSKQSRSKLMHRSQRKL